MCVRELCRTETTDIIMVYSGISASTTGCHCLTYLNVSYSTATIPVSGGVSLQAGFNASARMCVRDLRRTETTDIIMVYSGTMQALLALTACVTIPRSLMFPEHAWQWVLLLVTGETSFLHLAFAA